MSLVFLSEFEKQVTTYHNAGHAETVAALKEGDRIANDPTRKRYTDLNELWKDLES